MPLANQDHPNVRFQIFDRLMNYQLHAENPQKAMQTAIVLADQMLKPAAAKRSNGRSKARR